MRKISISIVSLIVGLIILDYYLFQSLYQKNNTLKEWVDHTHKVIIETNNLIKSLTDAETGQRGYLLTLEKEYLAPYYSGTKESYIQLKSLKTLTSDNLEQQSRLDKIELLINSKLEELKLTINLSKHNYKEAIEVVKNNSGKHLMDQIRVLIKEFILVEEELLLKREVEAFEYESETLKTIMTTIFFELLLIVFIILILNRKNSSLQKDLNKELSAQQNAFLKNECVGVFHMKDLEFLNVNHKFCEIYGFNKGEIIGNTPRLFTKTDEEFFKTINKLESALKNGMSNFELQEIRKDGTKIYTKFSLNLVNPEVAGEFVGIVEDITERKKLANVLDEQKQELETILHTTKDGIAILDLETNFLFANDAYIKMTGFTKEELLTKSCAGLSASEDLPRAIAVVEETLEKGFYENFEKTCIVADDKRVKVNMSLVLMPDKKRLLISTKDITESKNKERQIKEYVKLVDKNIITSSTDLDGNIIDASEAFCKISDYSKEELIGQNHRIIRHPDSPDSFYEKMWDIIITDQIWQGQIKNKKKNGGFYWVEATISPVFDEYGTKIGYTAIRQDITDKKELERISITDGLTGIFNRRHFNDIFPKIINSAKRENYLVSFIILDIDFFKQYNDNYGHQNGDNTLKSVAKCLEESLHRADDYCFRLGGEEFGIIYKTDSQEKSLEFANLIRKNIEELEIKHEYSKASSYITVSLGLVCKRAHDINSMSSIYKEADQLLYKAKKLGRNQVFSEVVK